MVKQPGKASLKPVDLSTPGNDFDLSAAFVEQRSRLERALPAADDEYLPSSKPPKIPVFRGVRRQRRWKVLKFRWTPSKRTNSGRDNHPAGMDHLAILEKKPEALRIRLHPADLPFIKVGNSLALV